ncbi:MULTISPECIES: hypothetical protein [Vibrio]|uniref:Uncharacterized protein n=2 Tax=Vibrio alginolyticus TaxID=663 RepID=A0AA36UVV6_VIBAL|nr:MULTISPECIES: hypothetical protein [Vibrio]EGQ9138262.1 hypothetical protein [Vibrio alginolyticus]EGR1299364.1 hypothetical protein [Vibrio alginolyticus]ELB1090633.1 hypothetical protein [Vibrio alginolyticus]ELB1514587.1 hypothetical protein [Vibrio alginolyticus]ELB1663568.1 hypothetical protein [Vibrio alginolyticus]
MKNKNEVKNELLEYYYNNSISNKCDDIDKYRDFVTKLLKKKGVFNKDSIVISIKNDKEDLTAKSNKLVVISSILGALSVLLGVYSSVGFIPFIIFNLGALCCLIATFVLLNKREKINQNIAAKQKIINVIDTISNEELTEFQRKKIKNVNVIPVNNECEMS